MSYYRRFINRIRVVEAEGIARRYFITNGFDGALTMIGLMMGFYVSGDVDPKVAIKASLGAAIALFMSGSTSAYISESAERQREIRELEMAMMTDMNNSHHQYAAKVIPMLVALVNGGSPLLICLFVMSPLWMIAWNISLPFNPFLLSIALCLLTIFVLGIYLSRISQTAWWMSGMRALIIALVTLAMIQVVNT